MTTVKTSRFSAKSVRGVRFSRIKCLKSKKYIYFAINIAIFCFSEETSPVQPFIFRTEGRHTVVSPTFLISMKNHRVAVVLVTLFLMSCNRLPADNPPADRSRADADTAAVDSLAAESPAPAEKPKPLSPKDIRLDTALLYDRYTLADTYEYQKVKRSFKWDQMREALALIENMQQDSRRWVVMQNYRNMNREAPLVKRFVRNVYKRVADTLGVERYQSVPLYAPTDTLEPEIYGRDGTLAHLCETTEQFYRIQMPATGKEWYVPRRYVRLLPDSTRFHHVIVVDRKDQNIATLEWSGRGKWLIRSKNPATTGQYKPPYAQRTPLGMFLKQEQKRKMVFLKDGSAAHGGYAPYASRFTNGAYIHGVPVNVPQTKEIEYSWSLGTTPRSHMCVRNATSHAKFVYEWAPVRQSLVVVIE